jgi:hypothetical protein
MELLEVTYSKRNNALFNTLWSIYRLNEEEKKLFSAWGEMRLKESRGESGWEGAQRTLKMLKPWVAELLIPQGFEKYHATTFCGEESHFDVASDLIDILSNDDTKIAVRPNINVLLKDDTLEINSYLRPEVSTSKVEGHLDLLVEAYNIITRNADGIKIPKIMTSGLGPQVAGVGLLADAAIQLRNIASRIKPQTLDRLVRINQLLGKASEEEPYIQVYSKPTVEIFVEAMEALKTKEITNALFPKREIGTSQN